MGLQKDITLRGGIEVQDTYVRINNAQISWSNYHAIVYSCDFKIKV